MLVIKKKERELCSVEVMVLSRDTSLRFLCVPRIFYGYMMSALCIISVYQVETVKRPQLQTRLNMY